MKTIYCGAALKYSTNVAYLASSVPVYPRQVMFNKGSDISGKTFKKDSVSAELPEAQILTQRGSMQWIQSANAPRDYQ